MSTPRDIAASLIVDTPQATETAPEAVKPETELIEVTTETPEDELEDIQPPDDVDEEVPDGSEDDEDLEDPGPLDDTIESFTFKVDGVETTATVEELISNYSIDGAARKRLQEATEARTVAREEGIAEGRQEAETLVTTRTQELDTMRQQFAGVIGMVGQQLFAPQVQPPDPAMDATDPIGYMQAKDRYRDDQMRIRQLQANVTNAVQQQNQQLETARQERQAAQGQQLRTKRPDLAEEKNVKAFTHSVRAAQNHVGFTQDEVDNFPDHRGLLLMELAGKYLALQNQEGPTPAQRIVAKAKKPITPGGVTYQRNIKQKRRRVDRERATASGDYKDIAKLLIQDAPERRR